VPPLGIQSTHPTAGVARRPTIRPWPWPTPPRGDDPLDAAVDGIAPVTVEALFALAG
jgi:hypothetical protein